MAPELATSWAPVSFRFTYCSPHCLLSPPTPELSSVCALETVRGASRGCTRPPCCRLGGPLPTHTPPPTTLQAAVCPAGPSLNGRDLSTQGRGQRPGLLWVFSAGSRGRGGQEPTRAAPPSSLLPRAPACLLRAPWAGSCISQSRCVIHRHVLPRVSFPAPPATGPGHVTGPWSLTLHT